MKTATIDTWAWVLIYAGLLIGGFGVVLHRDGLAFGWLLVGVGVVAVAAGVVLIFIRARMQ